MNVSLDDHVHAMADDERTACGLIVTHGTEWSDEPVDCPDETGEKPKKAKSGRKA